MNIVDELRLAITKFVRFWKPLVDDSRSCRAKFVETARYILEPLQELKKSPTKDGQANKSQKASLFVQAQDDDGHADKNNDSPSGKWKKFGKNTFRLIELCALVAAVITAIVIYW